MVADDGDAVVVEEGAEDEDEEKDDLDEDVDDADADDADADEDAEEDEYDGDANVMARCVSMCNSAARRNSATSVTRCDGSAPGADI